MSARWDAAKFRRRMESLDSNDRVRLADSQNFKSLYLYVSQSASLLAPLYVQLNLSAYLKTCFSYHWFQKYARRDAWFLSIIPKVKDLYRLQTASRVLRSYNQLMQHTLLWMFSRPPSITRVEGPMIPVFISAWQQNPQPHAPINWNTAQHYYITSLRKIFQ